MSGLLLLLLLDRSEQPKCADLICISSLSSLCLFCSYPAGQLLECGMWCTVRRCIEYRTHYALYDVMSPTYTAIRMQSHHGTKLNHASPHTATHPPKHTAVPVQCAQHVSCMRGLVRTVPPHARPYHDSCLTGLVRIPFTATRAPPCPSKLGLPTKYRQPLVSVWHQ